MDFSERVKLVRHAFGIGQKQIAEYAGTFIQNVSRWEKKSFEPRAELKILISDALNLSKDWFISGYGHPFISGKIVFLEPRSKHFNISLELLGIAIRESLKASVISWRIVGETYYSIYFHQKDSDWSIALLKTPTGYEKAFHDLIGKYNNVFYLGIVESDEKVSKQNLMTSFNFILSKYNEFESFKSESLVPQNYFFVELYNIKGNELTNFINSRAKTLRQKIDKLVVEKFIPDFLNTFKSYHDIFKKTVRAWIKGEPFTDKEMSILKEFIGESKLADIFEVQKKFYWDKFLIHGIKKNILEPFSMAYTELVGLIFKELQGMRVVKPKIDEINDKLYWNG